jgi:hypothetical protein
MEPTAGRSDLSIAGAGDFDAALALINSGMELLVRLGRRDPLSLAMAQRVCEEISRRFNHVVLDPTHPVLVVVPNAGPEV